MTFSIIVVCLNGGEKLARTVESILGQTEKDYEIIVKDGGSTDGSVEKLVQSDVLKLYREKDSGIYDAMNQAVKHASGKYIFFLNCGDYLYDGNVLSKVKSHIRAWEWRPRGQKTESPPAEGAKRRNLPAGKPCVYYGNIREQLTGALVQSNPHIDEFACYRNVPCHQACFYDRRLLLARDFCTDYRVRADYEHFLWCFYKARARMVYLPVTVASYEGGGFSEKKENMKRSAKEHEHIVRRYMSREKILRYRILMTATLAGPRTWLAGNPATAEIYQTVKKKVYEGHGRIFGRKR